MSTLPLINSTGGAEQPAAPPAAPRRPPGGPPRPSRSAGPAVGARRGVARRPSAPECRHAGHPGLGSVAPRASESSDGRRRRPAAAGRSAAVPDPSRPRRSAAASRRPPRPAAPSRPRRPAGHCGLGASTVLAAGGTGSWRASCAGRELLARRQAGKGGGGARRAECGVRGAARLRPLCPSSRAALSVRLERPIGSWRASCACRELPARGPACPRVAVRVAPSSSGSRPRRAHGCGHPLLRPPERQRLPLRLGARRRRSVRRAASPWCPGSRPRRARGCDLPLLRPPARQRLRLRLGACRRRSSRRAVRPWCTGSWPRRAHGSRS